MGSHRDRPEHCIKSWKPTIQTTCRILGGGASLRTDREELTQTVSQHSRNFQNGDAGNLNMETQMALVLQSALHQHLIIHCATPLAGMSLLLLNHYLAQLLEVVDRSGQRFQARH